MAKAKRRSGQHVQRVRVGRNVANLERKASLAVAAVLLYGGLRRGGASGALAGGLGGWLGYRGLTGACPVFERLGLNTASEVDSGLFGNAPLKYSTGVIVDRQPMELYQAWKGFTRLPEFMRFIAAVRPTGDGRARWVAHSPFGETVQWETELVEDIPNERLVWHGLPHLDLIQEGEVCFLPAPAGGGTYVELTLAYRPRHRSRHVRRFLKTLNARSGREDLRRFKRLMESGKPPGTITASRRAAPLA